MNINNVDISKAITADGKILDKEQLAKIISNICLVLKNRLGRDLGKENFSPGMIREINNPVISKNEILLTFRIGIVWCKIKATLNKNNFALENPALGVDY